MISYAVTQLTADTFKFGFKGKSTDTKPTGSHDGMKIANTSTFFEMDTQTVYFYDGETDSWLPQP